MEDRFENFVTAISSINKNITRIKQNETKSLGLKSPEVMCMYYLGKEGKGLTAAELAKLSKTDKAAVSRVMKSLIGSGYIYYLSSQKRSSPAVLTEKGQIIYEKMNKKIDAAVKKAGSKLSENERSILYSALFSICEELEKLCGDNT